MEPWRESYRELIARALVRRWRQSQSVGTENEGTNNPCTAAESKAVPVKCDVVEENNPESSG